MAPQKKVSAYSSSLQKHAKQLKPRLQTAHNALQPRTDTPNHPDQVTSITANTPPGNVLVSMKGRGWPALYSVFGLTGVQVAAETNRDKIN